MLNATSKALPLADMVRHYDALGLRCEWRLSYGQIAWFLTYLRFLVQVLVADADYGMLLNDDVRGLCGNQSVCRVHPIILRSKSFLGDDAAVLVSRRWRGRNNAP